MLLVYKRINLVIRMKEEHRRLRSLPIWKVLLFKWAVNLKHGEVFQTCTSAGEAKIWCCPSYRRMKHILLYASRDHYFSACGDRARQFDSVVIMPDYLIMRALISGSSILFVSALIYTEYKNPIE